MSESIAQPSLRDWIAPHTERAANKLHEKFPRLEADHFSLAGIALVGLGSAIAASSIKNPARLALPLNIIGEVTDTFNGALARVCYGGDPERLDRGYKVDSLSDLAKDLSLGVSTVAVASRSDSWLQRSLAEIATITTPLASLSRSFMETRGYQICEHGNSRLEFLGTRAGRSGVLAVAASNVRLCGVPLQPALDSLAIAGNLTRIAKNLTTSVKEEKSPQNLKKAKFRTKFHAASVPVTAAGILVARVA